MNLLEALWMALTTLAGNKMRSMLTTLGVLIGVGAVICMVAIGQGAKAENLKNIQQYGANVLTVFSGRSRRGAMVGGWGSQQTLTMEDARVLPKECKLIKQVAPDVRQSARVKYRSMNSMTTVLGTTPNYLEVRNFRIARGRMFTETENRSMARVCVVGTQVQDDVFRGGNPIGKTIRLAGMPFKVVGLMATKGAMGFSNPDDQITVPLTTAMRRMFGLDYIGSIGAQAVSMDVMGAAQQEVEKVLRKRHRIPSDGEPDFMIRNQAERLEEAEMASKTFMMLLAGIACVSLVVGGIGIMNIMLVSVAERTREIGIRKAVGAKRRDILLQFLIESVVLSVLGGCLGILAGIAASLGFVKFFGWTLVISPPTLLWAFLFAFVVGVFFGIYPAYKASALDPVEALRYE